MTRRTRVDGNPVLFGLSPTLGANPAKLTLINKSEVVSNESGGFHLMDQKVRGFSRHRLNGVRPNYLLKSKSNARPNDVLIDNSFLVVTTTVKNLFESIDAAAFEFLPINVKRESGEPLSDYWLCDVVRVLDALDEEHSDIKIIPANPKIYYLAGATRLIFRTDVIGGNHIFRMTFSERMIICNKLMRRACLDAKITGLCFYNTEKR